MQTELIKHIENEFQATYYDITTLDFSENKAALKYINKGIVGLSEPVAFFIKPDLGANMRSMEIQGCCHFILMKQNPHTSRELTEIAHEFGHLFYAEKGYPYVKPANEDFANAGRATIISNAIMDPMINRDLYNSGVDIVEYMQDAIKIQVPDIMFGYPEYNRLNKYQKNHIKCLLIEKIQEWDIIKNAIPNMFVEIADKKYKKLLMESRTFVKKIRAIGTNNPEKCRKLLNMLIVENNMENEILVI